MSSVTAADVVIYGSANMPDADSVTTGGAVDFSKRLAFNDISPTGSMDYVSSSALDTATVITLTGRDSSGIIQTEAKTLTGVTPVAGSQAFERILKGVVTGTTAVGDVAAISHTAVVTGTAQSGSAAVAGGSGTLGLPARVRLAAGQGSTVSVGQVFRATNNSPGGVQNQLRYIVGIGTNVDPAASADDVYVNRDWGTVPTSATTYGVYEGMLFEVSPNQVTQIRRPFYNVAANASGGASVTYYEKCFPVNNNTLIALTSATITLQSESPSFPGTATLEIGLNSTLNDTATIANRQTVPTNGDASAITFTTGAPPESQSVPGAGALTAGAAPNSAGAMGCWLKLTLPAGTASYKGSFALRPAGSSI